MKNKGFVITLAVIGVIALIITSVMAIGFFWRRGAFGGSCCQGFGRWNNPPGFGHGMMWGGRNRGFRPGDVSSSKLLSFEEADRAVNEYIEGYDNADDLHIKEIMVFDNHAYVMVVEEESGIGAFEVLVDPDTHDVYLEQGANMMWNLKYGQMRGGMMGRSNIGNGEDMPISENEAVSIARDYLAKNSSEITVDEHGDQFYGYYTIHTLENGESAGMLSVNGYSGQIIIHHWHGKLLEMIEVNDDH